MMFDAANYRKCIMDIDNNISNVRRVERGFAPFVIDTVQRVCELTSSTIPAIVELGIGGGGSQLNWKEYFGGAVYGVDLFSRSHREKYQTQPNFGYFRDHFDRIALDTDNANLRLLEAGIVPFWGQNAYSEETAIMVETAHGAPIDFVLDDAAPGGGALNGLMAAWRGHISNTGAIISETPFGNGTSQVFGLSTSERQAHCETLAAQGMIVFDMAEYAKLRNPPLTGYIMNYLAFYASDYSLYGNLLQKYEHNIVAGKSNWKLQETNV